MLQRYNATRCFPQSWFVINIALSFINQKLSFFYFTVKYCKRSGITEQHAVLIQWMLLREREKKERVIKCKRRSTSSSFTVNDHNCPVAILREKKPRVISGKYTPTQVKVDIHRERSISRA